MQNALRKTVLKDRDTTPKNLDSMNTFSGCHRIPGYDLARGLAVIMMLFINFGALFPDPGGGSGLLNEIANLLDRRAAVILVMVSGAGVSLMAGASTGCNTGAGSLPGYIKKRLISRSLFLLVLGYLLTMVWSGDILHFYGIFIFSGIYFLNKNNKIVLYALGFCWILNFLPQVEAVSVFLEESDSIFITPLKDLFFTGYFPLFPWMIFFLVGMLVGRISIGHVATQTGVLVLSLSLIVLNPLFTWLSFCLPEQYGPYFLSVVSGISDSLPFSILSGMGTGLLGVLSGTLLLNIDTFRKTNFLIVLGKTSLSLYVCHVFFIYVVLLISNLDGLRPSPTPVISLFLVSYLLFMRFWLKRYPRGPLEMFMRQFDPPMKPAHT